MRTHEQELQHAEDIAVLAKIEADGRALDERCAKLDAEHQRDKALKSALARVKASWEEPPIEARWEATTDLRLEVRAADDGERRLTGVATTPVVDRMGDIVDPLGATYAEEIPLLLYHDSKMPVGVAYLGEATLKGIPFVAFIAKVTEPGALKTRCDEAWQSVRSGVLKTVSIGFRSIEAPKRRKEGEGLVHTGMEILELSLVPIPANPDAKITGYKAAKPTSAVAPATQSPGPTDDELVQALRKASEGAIQAFHEELARLDAKHRGNGDLVAISQGQYSVLRQLPTAAMAASMANIALLVRGLIKQSEARIVKRMADAEAKSASLERRVTRQSTHIANLESMLRNRNQ